MKPLAEIIRLPYRNDTINSVAHLHMWHIGILFVWVVAKNIKQFGVFSLQINVSVVETVIIL